MPRTARYDAPGAAHHVVLRGIERRDLFRDHWDRHDFVARLALVLPEMDVRCFAWALMPNHVHLVLRTGERPLWRAMARIETGYALYFNRRHDRVGHLFQNRYKSIWIESDRQLKTTIRYVHLNPLRAGIVRDLVALARFRWTGHPSLLGVAPAGFLDVDAALSLFADRREQARARLSAFMEDPADAEREPQPPVAQPLRDLVDRVCGDLGVDPVALARGRRSSDVSRARALLAHVACDELGMSGAEVANALGVDATSALRARSRGRRLAATSPWHRFAPAWGVPQRPSK